MCMLDSHYQIIMASNIHIVVMAMGNRNGILSKIPITNRNPNANQVEVRVEIKIIIAIGLNYTRTATDTTTSNYVQCPVMNMRSM